MQGFKRRKACGCGDHQTKPTSIKIEQVIEIDLPGQGTLVDIKADPEDRRLQPAPDTAGDIKADPGDPPLQPAQDTAGDIKADPGDQPLQPAQDTAEGIPSNKLPARPRRAAAEAGMAKRIKSKAADNAMLSPQLNGPERPRPERRHRVQQHEARLQLQGIPSSKQAAKQWRWMG
ncbi:g11496 [Coccomyxa viridis]|uniref:G11496 protein n=1 Tax=Coccomyxa viridis TaxID=1274662 RepID=A0ABP1GAS7_9CHLO